MLHIASSVAVQSGDDLHENPKYVPDVFK